MQLRISAEIKFSHLTLRNYATKTKGAFHDKFSDPKKENELWSVISETVVEGR